MKPLTYSQAISRCRHFLTLDDDLRARVIAFAQAHQVTPDELQDGVFRVVISRTKAGSIPVALVHPKNGIVHSGRGPTA